MRRRYNQEYLGFLCYKEIFAMRKINLPVAGLYGLSCSDVAISLGEHPQQTKNPPEGKYVFKRKFKFLSIFVLFFTYEILGNYTCFEGKVIGHLY